MDVRRPQIDVRRPGEDAVWDTDNGLRPFLPIDKVLISRLRSMPFRTVQHAPLFCPEPSYVPTCQRFQASRSTKKRTRDHCHKSPTYQFTAVPSITMSQRKLPPDLAALLQQKKAEEALASKPRFIPKKERERLQKEQEDKEK